jgi:hypothetical protein
MAKSKLPIITHLCNESLYNNNSFIECWAVYIISKMKFDISTSVCFNCMCFGIYNTWKTKYCQYDYKSLNLLIFSDVRLFLRLFVCFLYVFFFFLVEIRNTLYNYKCCCIAASDRLRANATIEKLRANKMRP